MGLVRRGRNALEVEALALSESGQVEALGGMVLMLLSRQFQVFLQPTVHWAGGFLAGTCTGLSSLYSHFQTVTGEVAAVLQRVQGDIVACIIQKDEQALAAAVGGGVQSEGRQVRRELGRHP